MPHPERSCGSCTACCHTLSIEELGKPAFSECAHANNAECGGCDIYEDRPSACHNFRCMWLDGHLSEEDRPDKLGVIFTTTFEENTGIHPMIVEVRPGAVQTQKIVSAVDQLTAKSPVLVLTADSGTFHPRKREAATDTTKKTPLTING